MSEILDKVCKTIEKHNLLTFGDSVLCALSGGADSVCLLRVLCLLKEKYDLKIFAAHINHMLRGESADSDEEFAKELCKNFDVPFYSKKIDVLKYAKEHSQSTEEAGREVRYNFFYELCDTYNINKIATAHNLNDNTETVVMRFIRGTGINGLSGIPYKNNNIIRPILDLSRKEIEAFLKDENISFVTDKTNFEPVYFRNKVRLSLIPEIEEKYNQNFTDNLALNILNYRETADYLKAVTEEKIKTLVHFEKNYAFVDVDDFLKEHDYIKSSVVYTLLSRFDKEKQATAQSVSEILEMINTGKGRVDFSKNLFISVNYGKFFLVINKENKPYSYTLGKLCKVCIEECDKEISFGITGKKEKKKNCIFLDYEKTKNKKMVIRNRKDGDVFSPSGLGGTKKLKEYFIDEKIPVFLRDNIPLIVIDGEIACVGTMRVSEKFKPNGNTNNFLRIEISDRGATDDTKEC